MNRNADVNRNPDLHRDADVDGELDHIFGALADPTRRHMLQTMLRDGTGSAPGFAAELPITRQAVAKHLTALDEAGLIERDPGSGSTREVHYRLRPRALGPASNWIAGADAAWPARLQRLKRAVETGRRSRSATT